MFSSLILSTRILLLTPLFHVLVSCTSYNSIGAPPPGDNNKIQLTILSKWGSDTHIKLAARNDTIVYTIQSRPRHRFHMYAGDSSSNPLITETSVSSIGKYSVQHIPTKTQLEWKQKGVFSVTYPFQLNNNGEGYEWKQQQSRGKNWTLTRTRDSSLMALYQVNNRMTPTGSLVVMSRDAWDCIDMIVTTGYTIVKMDQILRA